MAGAVPEPENSSEPGWAPAFKEHTLVQAQGLPDPLGQWKEGAVRAQPAEATLESSRTPESVYSTVSFWIFIRKKVPHPLAQDGGLESPFHLQEGAGRGSSRPLELDRRRSGKPQSLVADKRT